MNSAVAPAALAVADFSTISRPITQTVQGMQSWIYQDQEKFTLFIKSPIYVPSSPPGASKLPCYLPVLGGLGFSVNGSDF